MNITRLLNLYRYARPDELEAGFYWYDAARTEVEALAASYDVRYDIVAAVVAVLSPNVNWETNIHDAAEVLATCRLGGELESIKVSTYNRNRDKAVSIVLSGEVFPHLSGQKVTAFYYNLCGDYSEPTLDSHTINAWAGRRVETSRTELARRTTTLRRVRADFIRASTLRHLAAARFQAIIWLTHKRRIREGKVDGYAVT